MQVVPSDAWKSWEDRLRDVAWPPAFASPALEAEYQRLEGRRCAQHALIFWLFANAAAASCEWEGALSSLGDPWI